MMIYYSMLVPCIPISLRKSFLVLLSHAIVIRTAHGQGPFGYEPASGQYTAAEYKMRPSPSAASLVTIRRTRFAWYAGSRGTTDSRPWQPRKARRRAVCGAPGQRSPNKRFARQSLSPARWVPPGDLFTTPTSSPSLPLSERGDPVLPDFAEIRARFE